QRSPEPRLDGPTGEPSDGVYLVQQQRARQTIAEEVDPRHPAGADRDKRVFRKSLDPDLRVLIDFRENDELRGGVVILRLVVVELPDWNDLTDVGSLGLLVTEYTALDFEDINLLLYKDPAAELR